ncbi:EKC/KEOPS complex subunit TPRKB-like [Gigantopelta aegis]|uniref:EKC/KEOPS complex subunit TPRKB-like n=1 Tax=Gigantopelta aegis TaxID=1735272 RepID=UPI001B88CD2C|nr:EKC/KEOPS complex subunit TPRKB-like [Gigantopelta aegis]
MAAPNVWKVNNVVYPDSLITLALFRDVANVKELRRRVMAGEIEVALIKTSMIVDPFQVIAATNKAVHFQKCGKMITKNVHSEILFCLSPSKSITESFRMFGAGDKDTSVLIIIVDDHDSKVVNKILDVVQGELINVNQVAETTDMKAVKKIYKLSDEELSVCSPLDAIVSRIAAKEIAIV